MQDSSNPGGETLNDRLRRAAAMARQHQANHPYIPPEEPQKPAPQPEVPEPAPVPESVLAPEAEPVRHPEYTPDTDEPLHEPRRPGTPRRPARDEDPSMYYTEEPPKPPAKSPMLKWMVALVVLMLLALLAMLFFNRQQAEQVVQLQQQNEQQALQMEQMQLASEYQALNNEFAQYENQTSLLANDSIVQKYSAARAQVEKLLQELKNEKQKSAEQISKLKGEIETLKGILRNYVEQINTLNQENQELRTENQQVKAQNQRLSQNIQSVQQDNKVLNERMTLAEKLNVTGVNLVALNKKGKTEKNVTKATQLMVTFTIPQNNSTPVGEKVIWLRIYNPEGTVLTGGGSFQFEGATLQASARKTVEYAGEEIGGIHIYWDVNSTLTPGDYTVELFCDNYRLTSRKFTLKK